MRPIVLERREQVGGAAVTSEIHPGFHVPTLAHACRSAAAGCGRRPGARVRRGVEVIAAARSPASPPARTAGRWCCRATRRTARGIWRGSHRATPRGSRRSTARSPRARRCWRTSRARCRRRSIAQAPRELWHLLKTGRRFRGLGRADAYRLLRMAPMPVADLHRGLVRNRHPARRHRHARRARHEPGAAVGGDRRDAAARRRPQSGSAGRAVVRAGRHGHGSRRRWPPRRRTPAPRSGRARTSRASTWTTRACAASCCRPASRSRPTSSSRTRTRSARCSALVDPVRLDPGVPAARAQHPRARHARQGEPRARGPAVVHGRARSAAGRARGRGARRPHPDRAGHRLPRTGVRSRRSTASRPCGRSSSASSRR